MTEETQTPVLRRTPLYELHVAAGAKLVQFAGWELPISYQGIREEHLAVRSGAGIFDVSHMGQVQIGGPQAPGALQHLTSNDVRRLPEGGGQYGLLCNEDGGVVDDLISFRLSQHSYLIVTNAANHQSDVDWIREHTDGFDVDVHDRAADFAMIAVQGPAARALVSSLSDGELPLRFHCCERSVAGASALVCGTGYTGEDGVELLLDPNDATGVWTALSDGGATPVGLGARDTLRLEAGFHLYGNDLSQDRDPIGAGLGWACAEVTGFVGSEAVAAARSRPGGPAERLVTFVIDGAGIARQGNPVIGGGMVTSGTYSPSLERGIGMAYVPTTRSSPGTSFEIDVRGTVRRAVVAEKPLHRKDV